MERIVTRIEPIGNLPNADVPEGLGKYQYISELISEEERVSTELLHLTANENQMSAYAQSLLSTPLSNRYHLGTLPDFSDPVLIERPNLIFKGLNRIYELEEQAAAILNRRLGGAASDFRCLSGVHAMVCAVASVTKAGDSVVSINPDTGGHFATSRIVENLGRKSIVVDYRHDELIICYDHLARIVSQTKIKAVFLDDSTSIYPIDIRRIRQIVGPDVIIIYDASHTLGLIFGGSYQNPLLQGCDILQGNTHKTFPGPQKALLHFADKTIAKQVMGKITESLVSSQHTHHSLALYITIFEMDVFGESYAGQIVRNAKKISEALEKNGFELLTNGRSYSDTHQVFIKIENVGKGYDIAKAFLDCGIALNIRRIFGKEYIRMGVQEVTRLGMKEEQMAMLADVFRQVLLLDQAHAAQQAVKYLKRKFNKVRYSFDEFKDEQYA